MQWQCSLTRTWSRGENWIWPGCKLTPCAYAIDIYYGVSYGPPICDRLSKTELNRSKKCCLGKTLTQCVIINKYLRLKIGLDSPLFHLVCLIYCKTKCTSSRLSDLTLNSFWTFPIIPTKFNSASSMCTD